MPGRNADTETGCIARERVCAELQSKHSGESREIAKPKFSHKVTSQMKVEDMKKGNLDTEMELFLNRGEPGSTRCGR